MVVLGECQRTPFFQYPDEAEGFKHGEMGRSRQKAVAHHYCHKKALELIRSKAFLFLKEMAGNGSKTGIGGRIYLIFSFKAKASALSA